MPICVGERLVTRYDFRPILDKQLANYIMPDIVRCCGISEMRKIATNGRGILHPRIPPRRHRTHHHGRRRPSHYVHPKLLPTRNRLLRTPLLQRRPTPQIDVRNGFYHVSDSPGLGHELNPDYVAAEPDKSLID